MRRTWRRRSGPARFTPPASMWCPWKPMAEDNPLLGVKNCFITPHIAWASRESRQRLMDTAVENLRAFLAGEPVNVVNLPLAGQSGGENGQTAGTGC